MDFLKVFTSFVKTLYNELLHTCHNLCRPTLSRPGLNHFPSSRLTPSTIILLGFKV